MAYDRDDFRFRRQGRDRDFSRDTYGRDQFRGDNRDFDRGDDRGFFERAGDEIASWFGDDDSDRRPRDRSASGRFDRGPSLDRDRSYRPMAGDYGRSEPMIGRGDDRYQSQRFSENPAKACTTRITAVGASSRSTRSTATMTIIGARIRAASKATSAAGARNG